MTPWFTLPPDRSAHAPPEARGLARDEVRLLVTFKDKDRLAHAAFLELPDFLTPGDLLVVNDSQTLPAALPARRPNGDELSLHLSTHRYPDRWVVEPRRITPTAGERLTLPEDATATLIEPYRDSHRLWLAHLDLPTDTHTFLHQHGHPIRYDYVPDRWPLDAYQTIFARVPGSAEMPSAARPFTPRVLAALKRKGTNLATITLHTGVASLEGNELPYEEWFQVPDTTAHLVRQTTAKGGRVIAVGTTVVRALESWGLGGRASAAPLTAGVRGTQSPAEPGEARQIQLGGVGGAQRPLTQRSDAGTSGWTDLLITPARPPAIVHSLLTGLHEPAATHLHMLESIAGRSHIRRAYRAALTHPYLWHEFGDVHLIL